MDSEIRNRSTLSTPEGTELPKRPLIGVPTGRERSQRFFGLPMYIMNQTYVRELEKRGALPVLIPLNMSEATLGGILSTLDGLFLPGGEDMDPANYGEERHPQLGPVDKERDRTELYLADEVFFTGTAAEVTPVVEVDHRPIGSGKVGEISRTLQQRYFDVVRGKDDSHPEWLTRI